MRLCAPAVLAVLLAVGCSPAPGDARASGQAAAPAVHPVSGLKVVPLTVVSQGRTHIFRVEVAASAMEQGRGLMFRTAMGADEGMIFPINPPRQASFWMRNTVIPLDLVFVGVDGKVSNIAANAVPYDETPLYSVGLVKGVLELNGGRAAELGIVPGAKVSW